MVTICVLKFKFRFKSQVNDLGESFIYNHSKQYNQEHVDKLV